VARLTKFKRIDFLLDVFRGVLKVHPDLVYHIVGTGEEEAFLRIFAMRLGVDSRVVFHGASDGSTLAGLYQRASLFLHGSVSEPFGMAPPGGNRLRHTGGGPQKRRADGIRFAKIADGSSIPCASRTGKMRSASTSVFFSPIRISRTGCENAPGDSTGRFPLRPAVEVIADLCTADGRKLLNPAGEYSRLGRIMHK